MLNASKSLVSVSHPPIFSQLHQHDWLKHNRIGCPACQSGYVMAVRRTWVEKMVKRQSKFWCQDCGEQFWQKD